MRNDYIAVIDSGLGGLTTASEIIRKLPGENIVFLGDTANVPYGAKSRDEIRGLSFNNIKRLQKFPLKALLIACNTSDSAILPFMQNDFAFPIFGVIAPAAAKAASLSKNHKIGIMATELTVKIGRYKQLIEKADPSNEVFQIACPKLVPLIEEGCFINDQETMIAAAKEYLLPLLEQGIDTLILGCTHYDVLSKPIKAIAPELKIVSSSRCVVEELDSYLKEHDLYNTDKIKDRKYFVTSDPERFEDIGRLLISGIKISRF